MVADLVPFEDFFTEKLKNERYDGAHCFKVSSVSGAGVDCSGDLGAW